MSNQQFVEYFHFHRLPDLYLNVLKSMLLLLARSSAQIPVLTARLLDVRLIQNKDGSDLCIQTT